MAAAVYCSGQSGDEGQRSYGASRNRQSVVRAEENAGAAALERIASSLVESGKEGEVEQMLELYGWLLQHPMNINRATKEDLEEMCIFTDFQVASLLEYRNASGDILSVTELGLVNGFTPEKANVLAPFIYFGKGSTPWSAGAKERSVLLVKGWWKKDTASYVGAPFYSQVKFRCEAGERWQAGITAEKDYGEKLFGKGGLGIGDFSSFHIALKWLQLSRKLSIERLIIGDYSVRLGQGLAIWNGFGFAGASTPQSLYKRGSTLLPYTSSDENSFQRGIAVSAKYRISPQMSVSSTSFFSLKNVDARITDGKYTSLLTDGLHNTPSLQAARKALGELIYGSSFAVQGRHLKVGINWTGYGYNAHNGRRVQQYNRYQMYNGQWGNFSADATFQWKKYRFFMEAAADYGGGAAALAGMLWGNGKLDCSLLLRSYSPQYIAPYSNPYSTSGHSSNQHGVSFVVQKWGKGGRQINAGWDYTYYPWYRYNTGNNTHVAKLWGTCAFSGNGFSGSVKLYGTWKNYAENLKLGVKGALSRRLSDAVSLRFRGELAVAGPDSYGYDMGTDLGLELLGGKLEWITRGAWYDCRSWECRLYMYEYDMPSTFTSRLMYGKGFRWYTMAVVELSGNSTLYLKADGVPVVKVGLKMRFF